MVAGADWEAWEAVKLPVERLNFWNEPYAELYDWFPWMRVLYTDWEIKHNCLPAWEWLREHSPWTPIAICTVYLTFCYLGPRIMANRKPFNLRRSLVAWNFLLAVFSFFGAIRTVPHLANIIYQYGFKYTICYKPSVWYGSGAIGLWTQAFIFSKIPELGDTVFVVLRKKPLIFLHWYHHVTVLLYCWHSYYEQTTYGLYFISMNYTVHAFMYLYYALAGMRIRLCKPYYITTLQISQMVVGVIVCLAGGYYISIDETPYISKPNFQAGVVMYSSYMLLFLQYALGRYAEYGQKRRQRRAVAVGSNGTGVGATARNNHSKQE